MAVANQGDRERVGSDGAVRCGVRNLLTSVLVFAVPELLSAVKEFTKTAVPSFGRAPPQVGMSLS
jgi:hypothetical protein